MRTFEGRYAHAHVQSLAFLPDGSGLVAGSNTGTVRLWDVATGRPRWQASVQTQPVRDVAVSPDGRTIAAASAYRGANLWAADGTPVGFLHRRPMSLVNQLAFHPTGQILITTTGDFTHEQATASVTLWDVATRSIRDELVIRGGVWSAAGWPGRDAIAVGTAREGVILWDPVRQPKPRTFPRNGPSVPGRPADGFEEVDGFRRIPTDVGARHVRFTPDGQTLVVAAGWSILFLDAADGRRIATARGHKGLVEAIDLSPDGSMIASAAHDKTVRLWDLATGEPRACYDWGVGDVDAVRFAPDGMTLAAGGRRGIVLVDVEAP